MKQESLNVIVIGGVAAGPKTAARIRRLMPGATITIIEKDTYLSYAGCGLPFYLSGAVRDFGQLFTTAYGVKRDEDYFAREKGVRVLSGHEAIRIDRRHREVTVVNLSSGCETTLPYDKLVLATGSLPFIPDMEGMDLDGVFRLNHPEDAVKISGALAGVREAVVVGAGLIGLEAASALREKGVFTTLIELKDQVLPGMLDPDMALLLQSRLEDTGMEFRTGCSVSRISGDISGRVVSVEAAGETINAGMVIVAAGVRPNTALAAEARLQIGVTGAIEVNEHLQTSDPDIYAVGDCTENYHLVSGKKVFLPMASTANRQGRVAGDNLAGLDSAFPGVLGTAAIRILEVNAARTGLGLAEARAAGFDAVAAVNSGLDRTHYHPSHGQLVMKLVYERTTGKLLGAQALGSSDAVKSIDVTATAIHFGATTRELSNLDLSYAPPFATPINYVQHTANIAINKDTDLALTVSAREFKEMLDGAGDFTALDVRTDRQFKAKHLDDPRVMQVALGDLRNRIGEIPRDREIIIICALGLRGYEAQRILQGAGFTVLRFLEGGLAAWPYEY